jgi:hypothetical protein
MKLLVHLFIILVCSVGSLAATSGSASPSANVGQLINIEVANATALGDIRVQEHSDIHVMTLTIDNNDDDGYTLNFHSDNGINYGVGDNFGYLLHESAADNTSATPNAGQKPATRYELLLGEVSAETTEYGHTVKPAQLVTNCTSGGGSKFKIESNSGTNVVFNQVDKATRTGKFNVCLSQVSDIQLFHGSYADTIIISISDN